MNRKRLLILAGLAIVLVCACASAFLFLAPDRESGEATISEPEGTEVGDETAIRSQSEEEPTVEQAAAVPEATLKVAATEEPTETAAPLPTEPPTSTPPPPLGMSRSNPFPMDALVNAPNWDVQVLEVVRGEAAWSMLQAANQFNEPPSEGMEYVLVRLTVKNTRTDSESHSISNSDFRMTGERLVLYPGASVVVPEPELNAELFTDGEAEGWVAFMTGQDEGQLMLVVDELLNFDEDRFRFIALESEASIVVDAELFDIAPTDLGRTRENPVPIGETAITNDWAVSVLEVIRGEQAWTAVQAANQFNEPPAEGMEYVAVKLSVRRIGTADVAHQIDGSSFAITGGENILYSHPAIVDPEPALDIRLFPGGQHEGWSIMTARIDEADLMIRFEPIFEFTEDNIRYLAITEGASLTVPSELAEIEPNNLGESRTNPAPLGETLITDDWEFTILEVIRGNDAFAMAQAANQFNEPPEPGTEYVAIRVRVRNISTDDEPEHISDSFFSLVDASNVEYDLPSIVDPDPALDIRLYPGGEFEGWAVLQAGEGQTNLVAVVMPPFSLSQYYLSLEP